MDTLILADRPDPLAEAVAGRLQAAGHRVSIAGNPPSRTELRGPGRGPASWDVVWLRRTAAGPASTQVAGLARHAALRAWLEAWPGRVLTRLNPDFWVRPERSAAEWRTALWSAGLPVARARAVAPERAARACVGAPAPCAPAETFPVDGSPYCTAWVFGGETFVWDGPAIPALAPGLSRLARWCGVDLMAVAFEAVDGVPCAQSVELMPGPPAHAGVHARVVDRMVALIAG